MSFLIKYSGLTKIITIFAGCSPSTKHAKAHMLQGYKLHACRFCRQRRQSYKKILNFEAYFIKIYSIGTSRRGVHNPLLWPYCRKQREFGCTMAK